MAIDTQRHLAVPEKISTEPEYMFRLSKREHYYALRHALIKAVCLCLSFGVLLYVLGLNFFLSAGMFLPVIIYFYVAERTFILRVRQQELGNGFWRYLAINHQFRTGRGPFVLEDGLYVIKRTIPMKQESIFKKKIDQLLNYLNPKTSNEV